MLIDKVYKAVQLIAAKDQTAGYISPLEFNRAAELAQLDIVTEKYNSVRVAGFGANYDREEMFSSFKSTATIAVSNGLATKPSDFMLYSNANIYGIYNGEAKAIPVDLVDDTEWIERCSSEIDPPTERYPIGRLLSTSIEVKPDDVAQLHITYIKLPLEPWWNYTASGRTLTFVETGGSTTNPNAGVTAGDSTDFTLGDSEFNQLVWKICNYVGIEIRDGDLYQLTKNENATDE